MTKTTLDADVEIRIGHRLGTRICLWLIIILSMFYTRDMKQHCIVWSRLASECRSRTIFCLA